MNLLFLSNGYGEDAIGAVLLEELLKIAPELKVKILPLAGEGLTYRKFSAAANIEILGPVKQLPSGGFIRGLYWIVRDILAGLPFLVWRQIKTLKKIASSVDYTVAIGDIFPLYLAAKILQKPFFFLSTAKSSFVGDHSAREELLMKNSLAVFPRDEKTALSLDKKGIPAKFLGNLMMDCLVREPALEPKLEEILAADPVIGLLPGSRPEAYENLALIFEGILTLVKEAKQTNFGFVAALAANLKLEKIITQAQNHGWQYQPAELFLRKKGILGKLILRETDEFLKEKEILVWLTQNRFYEVLRISKIIIGLAGTASEQAVGLGKPVVAFPGRGPQITLDFLKNQQNLLGGAVEIVLPQPRSIAFKIKALLEKPERFEEIKKIGQERMGEPGGASRMAREIIKIIESNNG